MWCRIEPRLGPARRICSARPLPWLTAPRLVNSCAALFLLHVGISVVPFGRAAAPGGLAPGPSFAPAPTFAAAEFLDPSSRAGVSRPVLGGLGTPCRGAQCGVRVTQLLEGLALERAGLVPGDVILKFDGVRVLTPADLAYCLRCHPQCLPAMIDVLHRGVPCRLQLQLGGAVADGDAEIQGVPAARDPGRHD